MSAFTHAVIRRWTEYVPESQEWVERREPVSFAHSYWLAYEQMYTITKNRTGYHTKVGSPGVIADNGDDEFFVAKAATRRWELAEHKDAGYLNIFRVQKDTQDRCDYRRLISVNPRRNHPGLNRRSAEQAFAWARRK